MQARPRSRRGHDAGAATMQARPRSRRGHGRSPQGVSPVPPPWRQVFNLSDALERISQVKNSRPRCSTPPRCRTPRARYKLAPVRDPPRVQIPRLTPGACVGTLIQAAAAAVVVCVAECGGRTSGCRIRFSQRCFACRERECVNTRKNYANRSTLVWCATRKAS